MVYGFIGLWVRSGLVAALFEKNNIFYFSLNTRKVLNVSVYSRVKGLLFEGRTRKLQVAALLEDGASTLCVFLANEYAGIESGDGITIDVAHVFVGHHGGNTFRLEFGLEELRLKAVVAGRDFYELVHSRGCLKGEQNVWFIRLAQAELRLSSSWAASFVRFCGEPRR